MGASKVVHDVTEVVAARRALARKRSFWRPRCSSIGDAVITTDADTLITFLTPWRSQLTGWRPGGRRGQPLDRGLPDHQRGDAQPVENPAAGAPSRWLIVGLANHTLLVRRDGTERPIDDSAAPIRDGRGRVVGCVLVFRDITAAKGRRRRARAPARERAGGAGRGRAGEPDEGRVPGHALARTAHAAQRDSRLGARSCDRAALGDRRARAQGLEIIERNARLQAQMIDDLLDMSRIISGKLRLDVQRVDLGDVVRAAVETVRHRRRTPRTSALELVLDPQAGPVARRSQPPAAGVLEPALATPSSSRPAAGASRSLLERIDSHVEVSVNDTGEGIGPEFLPHVFDRFRQADATTTRRTADWAWGWPSSSSSSSCTAGRSAPRVRAGDAARPSSSRCR